MQARHIMTSPVITVAPDTELRAVLDLLVARRISGVPVVDHGDVVGVVGSGDLVHRHEIGTEMPDDSRSWWQRLTGSDPRALAYVRSHGLHARDVMSPDVTTVADDVPLQRLATLFEAGELRRVLVLRDGQLAGLITRTDLIRTLARACVPAPPFGATVDDQTIRENLLRELNHQSWWLHAWSEVAVEHGVVRFLGLVQNQADRDAARIAAENVVGVRQVLDERLVSSEIPMLM